MNHRASPTCSAGSSEIYARDYRSGESFHLSWNEGGITYCGKTAHPSPPDLWLAPPLLDLQVNGFAGVDFQQDGLVIEDLLHATRQLRVAGCGRYFFTLISDQWDRLLARVGQAVKLRNQSSELTSAIAGFHIEGPFLSAEPGYRGAHDSAVLCDPTPAHIESVRAVAGTLPILLTLAPERSRAVETIRRARELGMRVSLGHTNASTEILRQALQAGAMGFTHLGNGCPQLLDRHDNILWRVLECPDLNVSLIPDAIHVSPQFFRLVHRLVPSARIYYTADAMAAAGSPPGRYRLGKVEVEVGQDGVVRLPGQSNFAGSALSPLEGVRRAAKILGRPWREIWDHYSTVPAKFMDLDNELRIGAPANFCVIMSSRPELLESCVVYMNGQRAADHAPASEQKTVQ